MSANNHNACGKGSGLRLQDELQNRTDVRTCWQTFLTSSSLEWHYVARLDATISGRLLMSVEVFVAVRRVWKIAKGGY
jgi:hypothetical protein